jgi:6-phosphogluconolactonase
VADHVLRLSDPGAVAQRVAADLLAALAQRQAEGRVPRLVLTGGSISRKVHAAVAAGVVDVPVDWARVEVWWGDERFVPSDDADRNAGQAWEDLLRHVPVDPDRVHAMPAADDEYADADAAAWAYGQDLREAVGAGSDAHPGSDRAWFDVLMLGIGPDGHCASLFPDHAEVSSEADVVAVHDSPKPPPTRISLGMPTLGRAELVWFVATGAEKADAVSRSVRGADVAGTPAAGPRGRTATTWYVDDAAAARL